MKTYAYVSHEHCAWTRAVAPGSYEQGQRVSQSQELWPWKHGKRETLRLCRAAGVSPHTRLCAIAVADLYGWDRQY